MHRRTLLAAALCLGLAGTAAACTSSSSSSAPPATGIHKIKHVVVIMQENRSFDSYFGTYPGVDGIPAKNGQFTVCVPDSRTKGCDKPFHDTSLVNGGAKHQRADALTDIDGGKMDGFVKDAEQNSNRGCGATNPPTSQCLTTAAPDVMGYHDAREIPNYWTYAKDFTLQDHMFEPVASWSLPAHLYMVSEWSASCKNTNPSSCTNDPAQVGGGAAARGVAPGSGVLAAIVRLLRNSPPAFHSCLAAHGVTAVTRATVTKATVDTAIQACLGALTPAERQQLLNLASGAAGGGASGEGQQLALYSWTDLTYLLHKDNVSWAYYIQSGVQPDCDDNPDETAAGCAPVAQGAGTPVDLEPAAVLHRRQDRRPARQHQEPQQLLHRGQGRHPPRRLLDHPRPG